MGSRRFQVKVYASRYHCPGLSLGHCEALTIGSDALRLPRVECMENGEGIEAKAE